jgi:hypothetical protein
MILIFGVLAPLSTIFQLYYYIMTTSFDGGGSRTEEYSLKWINKTAGFVKCFFSGIFADSNIFYALLPPLFSD